MQTVIGDQLLQPINRCFPVSYYLRNLIISSSLMSYDSLQQQHESYDDDLDKQSKKYTN